MKILAGIMLTLFLVGCGTPMKEVVVDTRYVVRTAVEDQKRIPEYPAPINVDTANQVELAAWIAATEERMWRLEAIIRNLILFYEAPVTEAEKNKDKKDEK